MPTARRQEGTPFQDSWQTFFDSLPRTSYLLVLLSLVDFGLVVGYCVWSVNRPAGAIEESLHISVALAVRCRRARQKRVLEGLQPV